MIQVHLTPGDGKGWALDEDLRQIRESLGDKINECGPFGAEVIHAPFWQHLSMVSPRLLKGAFVIAHADNPPFFYLKQPEFAEGQKSVDLWVARSLEAYRQFQCLGLPVQYIPYTIDPGLFFPIETKRALRAEFGIPGDAYVIANFHRDTEGADLITPKVQKNPELMVAILRGLRDQGMKFHVLLAGPRRHWIREALRKENMEFSFVGKETAGDDFGTNILDRETLNKLYNAADLYLVPSRWEGGPQSVMEAAACRCKILSVPVGLAHDILEPRSLFRSRGEAVARISADMLNGELNDTVDPQFERWAASHTTETMRRGLREIYEGLESRASFREKKAQKKIPWAKGMMAQCAFTFRRRTRRAKLPMEVSWNHLPGKDRELDEILESLAALLRGMGVKLRGSQGALIEIAGSVQWKPNPETSRVIQWIAPGMSACALVQDALLVAPSVQDVLNLRTEGCTQTAITIPILSPSEKAHHSPLIIAESDRGASLKVWRALCSGQTVIYPERSAYYEQVFHAGYSYSDGQDPARLVEEVERMKSDLRELVYLPSRRTTEQLLRTLLCSLVNQHSGHR